MAKILYLHGFNSAGERNFKVQTLEEAGHEVLYPTLEYHKGFQHVKNQIKKLVKENKIKHLVGTSLGGWWALYIANYIFKGNIKALAINSPLHPGKSRSLEPGKKVNYNTNEEYNWDQSLNVEYNRITHPGPTLIQHMDFLFKTRKYSNSYLAYNTDDEVVAFEQSIFYNVLDMVIPYTLCQKGYLNELYKNKKTVNYGTALAIFPTGGHRANNFFEIINCERIKDFFN